MTARSIHPDPGDEADHSYPAAVLAASPVTPPGAMSVCSWELDTEPGPTGPILVLRFAGEIDLFTAPVVEEALTTAVQQRPDDLLVDLAAVGFCALRGLTLIELAATAADRNGTRFALSALPYLFERIADYTTDDTPRSTRPPAP